MEITSPPYPRTDCNAEKLYELLLQLGKWIEDHRAWAEEKAIELDAPYKPLLDDLSFLARQSAEKFKNLAIPEVFNNYRALRKIRDSYDNIVRNYEEIELWDSPNCVISRLQLLRLASNFLTFAFLDAEKREAKAKQSSSADIQVVSLGELPAGLLEKLLGKPPADTISDADISKLFNSDDLLGGDSSQ